MHLKYIDTQTVKLKCKWNPATLTTVTARHSNKQKFVPTNRVITYFKVCCKTISVKRMAVTAVPMSSTNRWGGGQTWTIALFKVALNTAFFSVSFTFCSLSPMEMKSVDVSSIFHFSPIGPGEHWHTTAQHARFLEREKLLPGRFKGAWQEHMSQLEVGIFSKVSESCNGLIEAPPTRRI